MFSFETIRVLSCDVCGEIIYPMDGEDSEGALETEAHVSGWELENNSLLILKDLKSF